jgi:hypothetical protein
MGPQVWALLLALAVGSILLWRSLHPLRAAPRRLVLAEAPSVQWSGLTPAQRRGLLTLLKDELEIDGTYTVALAEGMGTPAPSTRVLTLRARRTGATLEVEAGSRAYQGTPFACLAALCRDLQVAPASLPRLVPEDPRWAWDLLEISGWGGDKELERTLPLCRRLVEGDPQLASAWCAYGQQSFRQLALDPSLGPEAQEETEARFAKALQLIPGFPRAAYEFANLKTDSARQAEALDLLFSALDLRPHAPMLYSGLAYAARTSGLLEGARRALARREALLGPLRFESGLVENTPLYSGDYARYASALGEDDAAPWRSMRDFYRGYVRLLTDQPDRALPYFRRAHEHGGASLQFEALAQVYELHLTGRTEEARRRLDLLCAERSKVREPDGEFTFKLAEACTYLGDLGDGVDMATRATAQGFICAAWYRMSPMLKPLQPLPRFQALLAHLEAHQRLLERRYPANRFG